MSTRSTRGINLIFVLAFAAAALLFVTGCNTIKGFGQDITGAAESTEQAFSGWTEPRDTYQPRESYPYRR